MLQENKKSKVTECVITGKEKDKDRVKSCVYPGYPAKPHPPPAPSLRMTGRQKSKVETHAVHHTDAKPNAVSDLSAVSDSSDRPE